MSNPTIHGSITFEDVGPLSGKQSIKLPKQQPIGVLARNGKGKTFITRALALLSPADKLNWVGKIDSKRLVSWGSKAARVSTDLQISEGGINMPDRRTVKVDSSAGTVSNDSSKLHVLFHIFSSDYVEYNVRAKNYQPNDDVSGHIIVGLGSSDDDIDALKEKAQGLSETIETSEEQLKTLVQNLRDELADKDGVRRNLGAWMGIDVGRVKASERKQHEKRIGEIRTIIALMKGDPEIPDFDVQQNPAQRWYDSDPIPTVLKREALGANLDEQFLNKMNDAGRDAFVKKGRQLTTDEKRCPYCEQTIESAAAQLIVKYREYLRSDVAEVRDEVETQIARVEQLSLDLTHWLQSTSVLEQRLADAAHVIQVRDPADRPYLFTEARLRNAVSSLKTTLAGKRERPEVSIDLPQDIRARVGAISSAIGNWTTWATQEARRIEDEYRNRTDRLKQLREELCNLSVEKLAWDHSTLMDEIVAKQQELAETRERLSELQSRSQMDRRRLYLRTLELCISSLFGSDVTVDQATGTISIRLSAGSQPSWDHNYMLSDGQRNGLAFCHYVASIHELTDTIEDYSKVILVIDDPMTSLDAHNLYGVMSIIRDIDVYLSPGNGSTASAPRTDYKPATRIVLTHSHTLYNALRANGIVKKWLRIEDGTLVEEDRPIVYPYDAHLTHIVSVANGESAPNHHTPNSCRHVLETIGRFLYPGEEDPFRYIVDEMDATASQAKSMLHDLSHGRPRFEEIDIEQVKATCEAVVDFLNNRNFGNQVAHAASANRNTAEEP